MSPALPSLPAIHLLRRRWVNFGLIAAALLIPCLLTLPLSAQTLARPGWAGSGMSLEPWWTHAILYEIDPHSFRDSNDDGTGDLRGLASQLDYIHSLGVDAITLTHFAAEQGEALTRYQAIDPALGSLDDFDTLVREASRDSLRVVMELDPQQLADPAALATVARFWLGRGVAGISLRASGALGITAADPQQRAAQLHRLREVTKSFAGQRILIGDLDPADTATHHGDADLTLDPALAGMRTLKAQNIRPALEHLQGASAGSSLLAVTDLPGLDRSATRYGDEANDAVIAKVLAVGLLATRANSQLLSGQEIGVLGKAGVSTLLPWGVPADSSAKKSKPEPPHGPEVAAEETDPDSLLNWYRHLIDLHHGNSTLRAGPTDLLNHDDQNALVWVSRKAAVTPLSPALVVVCNLSAQPVTLSLADDMLKLHLRGSFLRTVLRSDNGMGGMNLNAIKLPPFGVYIGELRF